MALSSPAVAFVADFGRSCKGGLEADDINDKVGFISAERL